MRRTSAVARPAPELGVQVPEKEMKSFEATKGGLAQAIKFAVKKGDAVDVGLVSKADQLACESRSVRKIICGKIIGEVVTPVSRLDAEDQAQRAGLQKLRSTFPPRRLC